MANNYTNLNDLFADMANAIRAKKNSTATIIADNFPAEIESLKSGFDYNNHDVTAIPDYAFYGCEDLKSVSCYNLTSVGVSAFENCKNLESVILWDSVESVGGNAFKGCDGLTIYCMFESQPEGWGSNWNPDGCEVKWLGGSVETWDISATEEDNVSAKLYNDVNLGMYSLAISGSGNMKDYSYDATHPTTPWYGYLNNITSITIPNSVTNIGNYAFSWCNNLISITIPSGVTTIGQYAFWQCINLISIDFPNSIVSIGDDAFSSCISLTSIDIPEGVTSIGSYTFNECANLVNITIPNSIINIGYRAFYGCISLKFNEYNNIYYLGNKHNPYLVCTLLKDTKLTSYRVHDNTKYMYDYPFKNCTNITNIQLPFIGKNIYSCNIDNSIQSAERLEKYFGYIFGYDTKYVYTDECHTSFISNTDRIQYVIFLIPSTLTSITILSGAMGIYRDAFKGCKNLVEINVDSNNQYYSSIAGVLFDKNATKLITYPIYGSSNYVIPNSVNSIERYAFNRCTNLASITIPNSVNSIGEYAFNFCANLTSIIYTGTISQWNSITFEAGWDTIIPDYIIHCTDGTISKDGTITYYNT